MKFNITNLCYIFFKICFLHSIIFSPCSNVPECVYFYQDQHLLLFHRLWWASVSSAGLSWSFPCPRLPLPPRRPIRQANTGRNAKQRNEFPDFARTNCLRRLAEFFPGVSPSKMNCCCRRSAVQCSEFGIPPLGSSFPRLFWQHFPSHFTHN